VNVSGRERRTTLGEVGHAEEESKRSRSLAKLANSVCSEWNSAMRVSQTLGQKTRYENP
jgi:hypothetical protein